MKHAGSRPPSRYVRQAVRRREVAGRCLLCGGLLIPTGRERPLICERNPAHRFQAVTA